MEHRGSTGEQWGAASEQKGAQQERRGSGSLESLIWLHLTRLQLLLLFIQQCCLAQPAAASVLALHQAPC